MGDDKKIILVVEDNPLNMTLTVDLLELNGFATLKAADGESAIETLKNARPDLIVLDIGLPGMSGFEVHKKIREDNRLDGVKIVALSASVMKEDEDKIRATGFDDYITKPIDIKDFVKKIRQALKI